MILVHITSDMGESQRICLVPEYVLSDDDIEHLSRNFFIDDALFERIKPFKVQPTAFAAPAVPIFISRAFFLFW